MPKGSSGVRDKMGNSVAVIDLVEREMAKQQQVAAEIYLEIDAAIRKIQGRGNAQRRLVLQLRYLDLLPWDEITFTLFGGEADFSEREQSYNRRCLDLHKGGVLELIEILKQQEE